jgi:GT2 family glycosyltransferase
MNAQPPASRFRRNDHPAVPRPDLGAWSPSAQVAVVVPARGGQQKLDLLLAALSAQTYPQDLMDVVITDDGSEPALRLPRLRPRRTRLLRAGQGRGGIAAAVAAAVEAAEGEVVLRLDADLVPAREHVEAHARWHRSADYLVVVGKLAFTDAPPEAMDAEAVRDRVAEGRAEALFAGAETTTDWSIQLVRDSGGTVLDEGRAFTIANGATISFSRSLYRDCGGIDASVPLGSDTELGYRLAQTGALFVPDPEAAAWHLGVSQMRSDRNAGKRVRHPYLANRVPVLRYLRAQPGMSWTVPYVEVAVEAEGASLEAVRATAASALSGSVSDVSVALTGPWDELSRPGRVAPLADPLLDLRLLRETFAGEPRVRFAPAPAETALPVPFRLALPAGTAVRYDGIERLLAYADEHRLGRLEIAVPGGKAVLDRTAAIGRASRCREAGEPLEDALAAVWGVGTADGADWFAPASDPEHPARLRRAIEREAAARRGAERRLRAALKARSARPRRTAGLLRRRAGAVLRRLGLRG